MVVKGFEEGMFFLNFYDSIIWTRSHHVSFSTVRLFPIHYSVILYFLNVIKPKSYYVAQAGLKLIIFLLHAGITITNVYHQAPSSSL